MQDAMLNVAPLQDSIYVWMMVYGNKANSIICIRYIGFFLVAQPICGIVICSNWRFLYFYGWLGLLYFYTIYISADERINFMRNILHMRILHIYTSANSTHYGGIYPYQPAVYSHDIKQGVEWRGVTAMQPALAPLRAARYLPALR